MNAALSDEYELSSEYGLSVMNTNSQWIRSLRDDYDPSDEYELSSEYGLSVMITIPLMNTNSPLNMVYPMNSVGLMNAVSSMSTVSPLNILRWILSLRWIFFDEYCLSVSQNLPRSLSGFDSDISFGTFWILTDPVHGYTMMGSWDVDVMCSSPTEGDEDRRLCTIARYCSRLTSFNDVIQLRLNNRYVWSRHHSSPWFSLAGENYCYSSQNACVLVTPCIGGTVTLCWWHPVLVSPCVGGTLCWWPPVLVFYKHISNIHSACYGHGMLSCVRLLGISSSLWSSEIGIALCWTAQVVSWMAALCWINVYHIPVLVEPIRLLGSLDGYPVYIWLDTKIVFKTWHPVSRPQPAI